MPELPEVETTRRGVAPHLAGRRVAALIVREARLRWPVAPDIAATVAGQRIAAVDRRAKYLLIRLETGSLMLHLGMSGSVRIVPAGTVLRTHDHLDLVLDDGHRLRFHDPRRFGSLHWVAQGAEHPLLAHLGPEPLDEAFSGAWLRQAFAGRRAAVKTALMDARIVVGVGNIYASEALYRAGIHPTRPAGRISRQRLDRLADAVKAVPDSCTSELSLACPLPKRVNTSVPSLIVNVQSRMLAVLRTPVVPSVSMVPVTLPLATAGTKS